MKIVRIAVYLTASIQLFACSSNPTIPEGGLNIEPLDCSQEKILQSESYEVKSKISFNNASNETVVVRWINYEGQRDNQPNQITQLTPGETANINTFLSHPFVVTDISGACSSIYIPQSKDNFALIK